ncbi:hypothetical protein CWI38_2240p0010 [Hamiltosporidium tvaerminnensis]|uniref:Uncharacterized protein n=1 Tax=Hamiltosporidium tvaerminnensis TaxID=1176355 RepID=A0A4Q9LMX8_9MICR|nr:hypothetical protein CWI38_2240p0010 [Hamiltosporidium tvaerminnensis]
MKISLILDLIVNIVEDVILFWLRLDDNTLSFINNCDFFKKIKHMYLIDPKKCDRFKLASIAIVNLRSIILFEYMKSYSSIDISENFLRLLYRATENEIYEGNKIPFTLVETMSSKELPLESILNLDNQSIGEFKNIFFDFFSSTVYEYFIYKFYGIISQNKIVDISNLQIKNSRLKEINSLKLFLNYRIRKIKISNCDINLRILKIIFEFKFLKDLTLSEVEILIDKNEIINFKNDSIGILKIQTPNILHIQMYLHIINLIDNLEELNMDFSIFEKQPIFDEIDILPKKT